MHGGNNEYGMLDRLMIILPDGKDMSWRSDNIKLDSIKDGLKFCWH